MKRNREQKARIRLISFFGLDKKHQRMLDEKVKQKDTGYFDIYTDLKPLFKDQILSHDTEDTYLWIAFEDAGFLIGYVEEYISACKFRRNNPYRLPDCWSVPLDPYDTLYPYDCLGGKKLREISAYEFQDKYI